MTSYLLIRALSQKKKKKKKTRGVKERIFSKQIFSIKSWPLLGREHETYRVASCEVVSIDHNPVNT